MISSFHVRNFKSYRDATLPLAPLTLLIGANASGKSNAIEAIRFLSLLAEGRRLDDILSLVQSSDEAIRGNGLDLPRDTGWPIVLGCELAGEKWSQLEIAVQLGRTELCIHDEWILGPGGRELFHLHAAGKGFMRNVHASGRGLDFFVPVSDQQAIFTQLDSPARFSPASPEESEVPPAVRAFRSALEKMRFLDPQPRRMRGYSYVGERALNEDGSNLSSILFDLCRTRGQDRAVLDFVAELPERPFTAIGFIETDRGDVMVRLTESYGHIQETRDAPVLSDGTLRVLAIAAALLSAEPGAILVIEEIDNGVHPSRAEALLRGIERIAKERGLRVLLTTHNPAILDRLPTGAIPHVVCAYRDPEGGDSRLVRLEDLPSYPELVARGPLGELMTRGVLDYFLKHQPSPRERQDQSRRWLETLKAQVGDA